jgi:hypothetical protein
MEGFGMDSENDNAQIGDYSSLHKYDRLTTKPVTVKFHVVVSIAILEFFKIWVAAGQNKRVKSLKSLI